MLPIVICDDNRQHLHKLKDIIQNCILVNNLDCKIILATQKGGDVISYIETATFQKGIYFLDIELSSSVFNGIELGKTIRNMNSDNIIIYITSHMDMAYSVFKHYLNCTDFIAKDDWNNIKKRIQISLDKICKDTYKETNEQIVFKGNLILPDKLFYIESATEQHRIIFHYAESLSSMWGSLKELEEILGDHFFRCNRSLIVNLKKVSHIDCKDNQIFFCNDKKIMTYASGIQKLKKKGVQVVKGGVGR